MADSTGEPADALSQMEEMITYQNHPNECVAAWPVLADAWLRETLGQKSPEV